LTNKVISWSQLWILNGEQYGLLTHTAVTESVLLRTPMKC
jgi:hypothetical protein